MDSSDNVSENSTHSSAFQDAQGHWYNELSSSVPSLLTATTNTTTTSTMMMATSLSMPLLTFTDQEHPEQEIVPTQQLETMCISNDDDSRRNEEEHQEEITSILSQITKTTATISSMSLSTTSDQEHHEQQIPVPIQAQTISISSDDDDNHDSHRNEEKHQEEMTASILPQEWVPSATSTPLSSAISAMHTVRSEQEIENDLFHNIEQLVREFVNRPNRQYPYYRVMRWTTDDQQQIAFPTPPIEHKDEDDEEEVDRELSKDQQAANKLQGIKKGDIFTMG